LDDRLAALAGAVLDALEQGEHLTRELAARLGRALLELEQVSADLLAEAQLEQRVARQHVLERLGGLLAEALDAEHYAVGVTESGEYPLHASVLPGADGRRASE